MDVRLTDEQELLRRSVREFAEAELRPHVREWDEAQQFPPALLSKFAELGLMGIQFPEDYGGAAMSSVDYCICIEELARVDPSVCLSVAAHNGLGAAHIFMFGTEEQKQQYLVPLATGRAARRVGAHRSVVGQRRGGDADAGRSRRRRLGDQRHQAVHHPRPDRRPDRRHGGDHAREGQSRHLRVHRRARHARVPRRQEGGQARDARERDERSDLRELPRAGQPAARRGGAGVHQRAAGARRRAHRHRGARRRPRAGRLRGGAELRVRAASSSASRSARFRASAPSSWTPRRESRRRVC